MGEEEQRFASACTPPDDHSVISEDIGLRGPLPGVAPLHPTPALHSLRGEAALSPVLLWLCPSHSAQLFTLCGGTEVPTDIQMSPTGHLPSRNL